MLHVALRTGPFAHAEIQFVQHMTATGACLAARIPQLDGTVNFTTPETKKPHQGHLSPMRLDCPHQVDSRCRLVVKCRCLRDRRSFSHSRPPCQVSRFFGATSVRNGRVRDYSRRNGATPWVIRPSGRRVSCDAGGGESHKNGMPFGAGEPKLLSCSHPSPVGVGGRFVAKP